MRNDDSLRSRVVRCDARYHINSAVRCYRDRPHKTHEGLYVLAGQIVTWTDDDVRPVSESSPPTAVLAPKTAIQEAFERARAETS